ncbi:MAG: glycosyltransferase [Solirubrobacterales bacterium]|nr:glycosyltransferase [Solirubrobacterales bacterium]
MTSVRQPSLSVLMPVRAHRPEYLAAAIGSLSSQTSPEWELLVVTEPGEIDRLERELDHALPDPRISLIANEGRKLAGALNTGMRHAIGAFVAILHADDLWVAEAVAVLRSRISANPTADFFHSARRIMDDQGHPISGVYPPWPEVRVADFWRGSPVKHLLCWRREMALAVGGMDETLNSVGPDDFDFPWTMAEHGARFVAVPECLYVYRDHRRGYRLTTHLPRTTHERELRRILKKHGVPDALVSKRVAAARATYLRQCLYTTALEARLRRLLMIEARGGWHQRYHEQPQPREEDAPPAGPV